MPFFPHLLSEDNNTMTSFAESSKEKKYVKCFLAQYLAQESNTANNSHQVLSIYYVLHSVLRIHMLSPSITAVKGRDHCFHIYQRITAQTAVGSACDTGTSSKHPTNGLKIKPTLNSSTLLVGM